MKIIIPLLFICSISAMDNPNWGNPAQEQTYYNEPTPQRPATPMPGLTKSQELRIEKDKSYKEKKKWLFIATGAAVVIGGSSWIYSKMSGGNTKKRR